MRTSIAALGTSVLLAGLAVVRLDAWSAQGHRLIALVAAEHLTSTARQNVARLLDGKDLADVAMWADQYVSDHRQTGPWHYVNIPPGAKSYDRDRDCPAPRGARARRWRDCIVDRILYNQQRLADTSLERGQRATALKFLVHLVGDVHQPFHAISVARGGNDIPVRVFGSPACAYPDGTPYPCNLHRVWDTTLIEHHGLRDRRYLDELNGLIQRHGWDRRPTGSVIDWAMESHALAERALLAPGSSVDAAYNRAHLDEINERLALGGLRLAGLLNETLSRPQGD